MKICLQQCYVHGYRQEGFGMLWTEKVAASVAINVLLCENLLITLLDIRLPGETVCTCKVRLDP